MAHDYDTDRRRNDPTTDSAAAADPSTSAANVSYTSAGTVPPVGHVATSAAPTASEQAFGPHRGPGVEALEALLLHGTPESKRVVDLIDAHRDEHDAMFALLTTKLGAAYVDEVRDSMKLRASLERREVVAGDPNAADGGFFIGSQAEGGARWRTPSGNFTGTANKDGVDAKYRFDGDNALHASTSQEPNTTRPWALDGKDETRKLAWEHDGKNEGELYETEHGRDHGSTNFGSGIDYGLAYGANNENNSKNYELGLRRSENVGGGTLTEGLRHSVDSNGATDGVYGNYSTADGRTTAEAGLGLHNGHLAETASVAMRPNEHETFGGSITHDDRGITGVVGGTYQDERTAIEGNVTRAADQTSLHLGASEQFSPEHYMSAHADYVAPDHGAHQANIGVMDRYRSGEVVRGLEVDAGQGASDYLRATGSVDAQLAPNLYGGAWGSYQMENGHHASAEIGSSLTFTMTEKTALTLAGVIDQNGQLETRLQLDVFKSRVNDVADLSDHKKGALVSLFVSYAPGGDNHHALDDRFGAPQESIGSGNSQQLRAGVRIKF